MLINDCTFRFNRRSEWVSESLFKKTLKFVYAFPSEEALFDIFSSNKIKTGYIEEEEEKKEQKFFHARIKPASEEKEKLRSRKHWTVSHNLNLKMH